jgi:tetratricopeptide (TPR) repeat protein
MPGTYNGIGTWYYGKKDMQSWTGHCDFCGHNGEIQSYTTTQFFVLFFIPIFSLGERRVINYCTSCKKHYSFKHKQWEELKKESLEQVEQAWRGDVYSKEKAVEALKAACEYHDEQVFQRLGDEILTYFGDDAEVLGLLAEGYTYFGRSDQAEKIYRKMLNVEDRNDVREELAATLVAQQRPDEARYFLEHILEQRIQDKLGLLFVLIEGYQAVGDHKQALQLIDRIYQVFPELVDSKTLEGYKKVSQKNEFSRREVVSSNLKSSKRMKQTSDWWFRLPKLIGPVLIGFLMIFYTGYAYHIGQSREVFLVNGLNRAYKVEVNGVQYELDAFSRSSIRLIEGMVRVKVLDELGIENTESTFEIKTPLLLRPINNRLMVLNPDRNAILYYENTKYFTDNDKNHDEFEPEYRYFSGRLFYNLDGVNYPFKEFPDSLELSEDDSKIRTRVDLYDEEIELSALAYVLGTLEKQDAAGLLKNRLAVNPDNTSDLGLLAFFAEGEEAIEFLRSRLNDRPVKIDWHRAYQSMMDQYEPLYNLEEEYQGYLEQEPENNGLLYLLGRVTRQKELAEVRYLKSVSGKTPCAYGYNAMAVECLNNGEFAEALKYINKALAISDNQGFANNKSEILLALGEVDMLLANMDGKDDSPVTDRIIILALNGKQQAVLELIASEYERLNELYGQEKAEPWRDYYESCYKVAIGDVDGYKESISRLDSSEYRYQEALLGGDLERAATTVEEMGWADPYTYLLLYIAAQRAGAEEQAHGFLDKGVGLLNKDYEMRRAAEIIKGRIDSSEAFSLSISPSEKRILLATLGCQHPELQQEMFRRAKILNFQADFNAMVLRKILGI